MWRINWINIRRNALRLLRPTSVLMPDMMQAGRRSFADIHAPDL